MTKKKAVTTARFDPKAIPMKNSEGHPLLLQTPEFKANLHSLSKHVTESRDLKIKEKAVLWSLIHIAGTRGTFVLALADTDMLVYTTLSRASLYRALTSLSNRGLLKHAVEGEFGSRIYILLNPKTARQFDGFVSRKHVDVVDHLTGLMDLTKDDIQMASESTPLE